jgi:hypothetical protein
MEKESIPSKEAIALKKLGFDKPCFCYYDSKKWRWASEIDYTSALMRTYPEYVLAPLYQQAFDFFREKQELHSWVEIGVHEYCYEIYSFTANKRLTSVRTEFNGTFEEARLECLRKLIEIVKGRK